MDNFAIQANRAYEPYRREALHCFWADAAVSAAMLLLIVATHLYQASRIIWAVFPLLFLVEGFVNYRLSLCSFVERRRKLYRVDHLQIVNIREDRSASGHWGSIVPQLYSPKMYVDRYRIKCRDADGRTIQLRCVMSGKKHRILSERMGDKEKLSIAIRYGKLTHIIITYLDQDETAWKLNHMF